MHLIVRNILDNDVIDIYFCEYVAGDLYWYVGERHMSLFTKPYIYI